MYDGTDEHGLWPPLQGNGDVITEYESDHTGMHFRHHISRANKNGKGVLLPDGTWSARGFSKRGHEIFGHGKTQAFGFAHMRKSALELAAPRGRESHQEMGSAVIGMPRDRAL